MKFFIAFVALAVIGAKAASLSEEQKQKLIGYHKECQAQSGVENLTIEDAKAGKYRDDPKAKEHLLCVSKKVGLQNEAGELQKDVITEKLSKLLGNAELAQSLVAKCAVAQATPQDTAYSVLKCYHENTPDHISLV
ncbi:B2 protein-like [Aethina tumida]|uniref:B2 protein-like n=1 Tax=Aethina tumida TaxID=116153 RepID=UPI00096ADA33|nr:B2 protein-like [Aethina tumida]